jgi:hypothetical protein
MITEDPRLYVARILRDHETVAFDLLSPVL